MSELVRRTGVPGPTIKFYVREGLLPEPRRTSRNMAWYDAGLIPRIQTIKRLQRERFLPLKIIREVLARADVGLSLADAIEAALRQDESTEIRTADELAEAGVPMQQVAFFESLGLVQQTEVDSKVGFAGDDLALLRILGSARRAGLRADMLPYTILAPYVEAVRALAELEVKLFEEGVMPAAEPSEVPALVERASELSERLLVLLRRKMLRAIAKKRATENEES
ncbi:MAG: MerR family transcriptional regulator [Myxococcota bacterium]